MRFGTRRKLEIERLEARLVPADFNVTNPGDSGTGSLRQAILSANATAGSHQIFFDFSVTTIQLNSALPALARNMTLFGTGTRLVIRPTTVGAFRLFTINGGVTATLSAMTLSDAG